jgi:phosphoribosyl 1,2-cyclic phosphate phosphodiesterase
MKALYKGCDLWIADALRRRPHPTHATLDAVLGWASELGVGHTALIHMDNTMDYAAIAADLPLTVEPGYDGLEFVL